MARRISERRDAPSDPCAESPLKWIETEKPRILHPTKGFIALEPRPYQKAFLEAWQENRRLILKSRQIGCSLIVAALAVWKARFRGPRKIVVISCSKDKAQEFLRYCKQFIPEPELVEDNKGSVTLANDSRIITQASGENSARSLDASDIILDELAYVKHGRDYALWRSAQPAVSTGGSITVLSTPDGPAGKFYDLVEEARSGKGDWSLYEYPWSVNPDFDEAWAERTRAELSLAEWAEAYDCDFGNSGDTMWALEDVRSCYRIEGGVSGPPEEGRTYLVTADMAGMGKDWTVVMVIDTTEKPCRIRAVEKFNKVVNDVKFESMERLSRIYGAKEIHLDATGQSALDLAEELNKYLREKGPDLKRKAVNFVFTSASKEAALTRLTRWFEKQQILHDNPDLFRESRQYKLPDTGLHTDHVMALAIAAHLLEKPNPKMRVI